jgi:hypothetical protein
MNIDRNDRERLFCFLKNTPSSDYKSKIM